MNISHSDALVFFGATGGSIPVIRHVSDSIVKVIIPLLVSALFAATSGAQSALAVVWRQIITWQRPARSSLVTPSAASAAGQRRWLERHLRLCHRLTFR
jgi:hypothetical protein